MTTSVEDGEALYYLGLAYQNPNTNPEVPYDLAEGERVLIQAVKAGNMAATMTLAQQYYHGINVKKNLQDAAQLYEVAAFRGNPDAQFELGNLYLRGFGVEKDHEGGISWWEKAALNGSVIAQKALLLYFMSTADRDGLYRLGRLYSEKGNQGLAIEFWEAGAEMGDLLCQYYLGFTLYYYKGLRRSEGMDWLEKAAAGGSEEAKTTINRIYETETVADSMDSVS